ncbi:coiled-coil domain-containing protein 114 [Folsomia candida]|nr:coiled-coil domain-containing protein 114 [Folsomia candida]XP_035707236.1 coiled-coil domain-containing protein 114 [Folsomia candida]
MESNVDRITQRLVEQKLKVQALYGQSMTVPQADHRKRILENRLYHVTTQFDTLVSHNKQLKQEINMMLKLRGNFYRRMLTIKKLSAKIKQRMGEVVYEATAAYDQRDEWVNKINILRERNDKDSKQHVLEIKEFQRVLHHDSKIHEFLAIKNKEREQLENASQRNDRKNQVKITDLDALLAAYKKSFKAILRMAKSRDIESLVNTYLEEEQKNYAVFKFITDLNHEANSLQEDIGNIKAEIEELARLNKETTKQQEETLSALDAELDAETHLLESSVAKFTLASHNMESFGHILDETFNAAGCSDELIIGLLGNQQGIKPHNIALVMKVVEHRTTELLFEKGLLEVRKSVELDGNPLPKKAALWVQGQKPAPQGGPFKPQVHVTGRVDAEQDEDDNETKAWSERPVYYGEMKDGLMGKDVQVSGSQADDLSISPSNAEINMSKLSMVPEGPSAFGKKPPKAEDSSSSTAVKAAPPPPPPPPPPEEEEEGEE